MKVIETPLKTGVERRCTVSVRIAYSTCDTRISTSIHKHLYART